MLTEIDYVPEGLLDVAATELHKVLKGPTLIHLDGEKKQPLFISTLLHGNEDTGLMALQSVLKDYANKNLPRALSVFIGNVSAAATGQRHLDGQPDYNRTWPGTDHEPCAETKLMQQVVDIMKLRHPFASIDIHNNTGRNPHYGCVNRKTSHYLQLARLFSHTVVYFETPKGVQSEAFAKLCPSVTLECGKVGDSGGIEHAKRYIETVMELDDLPDHVPSDIDLFHTVAVVKVPEEIEFGFDGHGELTLNSSVELYNFREMEAGSQFATVNNESDAGLQAMNDDGEIVTADYFEREGDNIVLKKPMMPSMFTRNIEVIRQDCLCYLMERINKK